MDFDLAVVDFMDWWDGKAKEQVIGKVSGKKPGKNETWVPKYKSADQILALYQSETDFMDNISPDVAAITKEAIGSILDDAFGSDYA